MSHIIIRSCIDFDSTMFLNYDKKQSGDFYFYHLTCEGKDLMSQVVFKEELKRLVANACLDSKYIPLWREKEGMYTFEKEEDICFSQEYYALKSKITEDAFRAVIITDDLEVFEVQAEIVGHCKDFDKTGELDIIFATRYKDSLFSTSYAGKQFSSAEGYLSTRDEFVL